MKTTINQSQFQDAFMSIRPDNFSYEGLSLLFDFLEELENDLEEEIELDVIAFCCDFEESSMQDVIDNYSIDLLDAYDDYEIEHAALDFLNEQTIVVGTTDNNTIIFQSF